MTTTGLHLKPADAVELAELLQFLVSWLDTDHACLDSSLTRFVGSTAYNVYHLRGDLDSFAVLLGADGMFLPDNEDQLQLHRRRHGHPSTT